MTSAPPTASSQARVKVEKYAHPGDDSVCTLDHQQGRHRDEHQPHEQRRGQRPSRHRLAQRVTSSSSHGHTR